MPATYADWEPNRSIACDGTRRRHDVARHLGEGREALARGAPAVAAAAYQTALESCPTFAEPHYGLGRARRALGETEAAWKAFLAAVEYDGMPLRARPSQNDVVLRLGAAGRVRAVDAVAALRSAAPDGLIGDNLMVDGHHPNERGNAVIAEQIARRVLELSDAPGARLVLPTEEQLVGYFGWDEPGERFERAIRLGRWFSRLATWRWDPDGRLARAEACFFAAREIRSGRHEPDLGLAVVQALRGDAAGADRFLAEASNTDPEAVAAYLRIPWVASVFEGARERAGAGRPPTR